MGQATLDKYKSEATGSTGGDTESIEVPTPPPADRTGASAQPHNITDEELEKAVARQCEQIDTTIGTHVPDWVTELPRWVDEDDIPNGDSKGPNRCDHCGGHRPTGEPLERGRELGLAGNDGNPLYDPCPPGKYNVEACECCGCPGCFCKSIYARQSKRPRYRCRNPDCGMEFEHPVELPLDPADTRRRLHWSCDECDQPNLAPFEGIPELDDLLR